MLREWAPLTELFKKLPTKIKKGLLQRDIKLTCVDVLTEYLVLGTNVGSIFLFDRKTKSLLTLRCEKNHVAITSVKILSTVDYMVASATESGSITIFQIPKSHPESLPESLRPKTKQVEKYLVTELHKGPVTTLEWSKNGMKLFSGDKNGLVVLTEIDFYMHICKSTEILNEAYEVVQLSYSQQYLLVSTTYRSIICQQSDTWKVCQIGRKDRKILGNFGALIFQKNYKPSEACLYCTRPGLRIWIADINGNVQNTLLFKDLLSKECPEVPILNPISKKMQSLKVQKEATFGILLPFDEKFLVTYSSDMVYVLDPKKMVVMAVISQLRGVLDVATYKDEIFILEEDRSLIRISYCPELECNTAVNDSFCNAYFPISTPLRGLTEKLQSGYTDMGKTIDIFTDENAIIYVEEATGSPIKINKQENHERFDKIGKQKYSDEILYRKSRKREKNSRMTQSAYSVSSSSSDDKEFAPVFMNSFSGVLPDIRSPDSIKYDIEEKEKMLEKLLDLDKVEIPDLTRLDEITQGLGKVLKECDISNSDDDVIEEIGTDEIIRDISSTSDITNHDRNVVIQETPSASTVNKQETKPLKNEFIRIPSCSPLPSKWVLSDLQISNRKNSSVSDSSMSDWEIL